VTSVDYKSYEVPFKEEEGNYVIAGGYRAGARNRLYSWRSEIVAYIDSDYDFYGIILGGTEAVSNDKRDDLEKVVKRVAKNDDVFTVGSADDGTISVLGADGVRRNYRRLKLVKEDVKGLIQKDRTADIYEIAGTSSHVIAKFNKDGSFSNWAYYYGANNTKLKQEWGY
jgi:hypothetical protein